MTGNYSRNKGARYERELTHYLGLQFDCQVITSRNGRGGAQGGEDLMWAEHGGSNFAPGVRNWSIEAKWVASKAVPTWLKQAKGDAHGPWWVVLRRTDGTGDRNEDQAFIIRRMLIDFVVYGQPTREYEYDEPYVELTAGEWCEIACEGTTS